jgi:hypothetical protein
MYKINFCVSGFISNFFLPPTPPPPQKKMTPVDSDFPYDSISLTKEEYCPICELSMFDCDCDGCYFRIGAKFSSEFVIEQLRIITIIATGETENYDTVETLLTKGYTVSQKQFGNSTQLKSVSINGTVKIFSKNKVHFAIGIRNNDLLGLKKAIEDSQAFNVRTINCNGIARITPEGYNLIKSNLPYFIESFSWKVDMDEFNSKKIKIRIPYDERQQKGMIPIMRYSTIVIYSRGSVRLYGFVNVADAYTAMENIVGSLDVLSILIS